MKIASHTIGRLLRKRWSVGLFGELSSFRFTSGPSTSTPQSHGGNAFRLKYSLHRSHLSPYSGM